MAFFEIKDPNYSSDQIEAEILASLKNRKISYDQEGKFFEKYSKYNPNIFHREFCYHPLTPFKLLFSYLPRWSFRIDYEKWHPVFFMKRWDEQIKRDLGEMAIRNHVQENLEPRHQLEYLLYDRFLLIKRIERIENESNGIRDHVDKLHESLSWRIIAPIRNATKNLKRLVMKRL